jgi:2-polyprenyl-6-methoxyphenol hydroxylase-like FAD-dependent oxidoreductase
MTAPALGPEGDDAVDGDVAIVGCGPVGLALAILVAQHGHAVTVLERWPSPYPLPRAVHFDHEVGRVLQACGIGPELRDVSEPAEVYEWRNAAGTTLLRFGRIGAGPSGWPASSMFCQPELEALLERRAGQLPTLEIRRGVEVVAVDQTGDDPDDHVVLGAADGSTVRARFAVGCDGANSTVRGLAGLDVHDLGFFYDWLIVDVILDHERVFDPLNLQICDPARPTTVVSGGPGRRRWEFMRLPDETLDDLDDASRAWALLAPWDVTPGNARLERHAVYTFQARYAERWRAGRVLLAGDAAHQMPPFAGQGMCSGIRDAANLAWKLHHVLAGEAPDALLDTYAEERLPSVRTAIDFSMSLGEVICVADPGEATARDEAMAAAVTGELSEVPDLPGIDHGFVHDASPHAGHLFVQGRVDSRPFADVHGAGWRLVTLGGDATGLDPALVGWFTAIGGRVVALADRDPANPDPVYARWFAEHEVTWALQRPDFLLYGTATDADAAGACADRLVAALRHHLSPTSTTSGSPT